MSEKYTQKFYTIRPESFIGDVERINDHLADGFTTYGHVRFGDNLIVMTEKGGGQPMNPFTAGGKDFDEDAERLLSTAAIDQ